MCIKDENTIFSIDLQKFHLGSDHNLPINSDMLPRTLTELGDESNVPLGKNVHVNLIIKSSLRFKFSKRMGMLQRDAETETSYSPNQP